MSPSFFALNRLRVMRLGRAVYDQRFHLGVNIIRGQNGSGKSTIADFIFYVLGGEFDSWKKVAKLCDEVHAEVTTLGGKITIRRQIEGRLTPPLIFFGPMEEAEKNALDGWSRYPIRRSEEHESFSQILFRSSGIPEAQSQGSANVTMHQLMRLLYSDQRTPAPRLFRFELFDTTDIREAVGNLICGLDVYDLYAIQLKLRDLDASFSEKQVLLKNKMTAIPMEMGSATIEALDMRINQAIMDRQRIASEIGAVDILIGTDEIKEFVDERNRALKKINEAKSEMRRFEQRLETLSLELEDLRKYISFLGELSHKLPNAERSSSIVGNIDFTYCPSCLNPLTQESLKDHCVVCGAKTDPDREQAKYLQIKLDLDIQARESQQLEEDKAIEKAKLEAELRGRKQNLMSQLTEFSVRYDLSTSPRESFLAQRNQRIGQLEREVEYISRFREIVLEIRQLSEEKAEIQRQIALLKDNKIALEHESKKRRAIARTLISRVATSLLHSDLPRQQEFRDAESVSLEFGDDAILVDGEANFAESSNVILKNAAILAIFSAATIDPHFFHPRFVLLDNVEDKGMEQIRSHNFQQQIVRLSEDAKMEHQIIYTTSMMNPDLDLDHFVIGPAYTEDKKTLDIGPQEVSKTLIV